MDERKTARVLLLGPDKRILLVKFHDESIFKLDAPGPSVFWATVGGKLEPGEDVMAAAIREAREEIGRTIRLGPKLWYGEQVLHWNGALTLFKETFVVAFLDSFEVTQTGWSEIEKNVIKEMRWWTLDDLVRTDETVYPAVIKELLPPILAGDYPAKVLRIDL